jgi:hypothetical protein
MASSCIGHLDFNFKNRIKTLKKMKSTKILTVGITVAVFLVLTSLYTACTSAKQVTADKAGAQIWAENCIRCHSTPSPTSYNDVDWETTGLHMRLRGNLTAQETSKVIWFMQSAN